MAEVRLSIAGRNYVVACNDGEETRLNMLGAMVDEKAREAGGSSGGLNETRLLLFSALLLADKLHDGSVNESQPSVTSPGTVPSADAITALEALASRLENLALRLEN